MNALSLLLLHNIILCLFLRSKAHSNIINRLPFCKGKGLTFKTKTMDKKQPNKLGCIVFDFDGTLAELRLDFGEMKSRLGRLGRAYLDLEPAVPAVPALEWLEILVARVQKVDAAAALEFQDRAQRLIVDMEMEAARNGALFPFTRNLLEGLKEKKIKVAIITRNCEKAVRLVFPDLGSYCMGLLAREHVPRVKPDPDHLFRALQHVAAPPQTALMVGDHPLDIETGKRAGILTAGVWSGRASQQDLIQSGAHWTAQNCRELILALECERLL